MRKPAKLKKRDWTLRITDILEAMAKIEDYIAGMTRDAFLADRLTIDAVTRNIEIIGEAAAYVPGKVKKRNNGIPWEKLRKFRNYLAHEYFGVDDRMVWETATRNLPPLRPALERALKERFEVRMKGDKRSS